jgi:hypothetical protein
MEHSQPTTRRRAILKDNLKRDRVDKTKPKKKKNRKKDKAVKTSTPALPANCLPVAVAPVSEQQKGKWKDAAVSKSTTNKKNGYLAASNAFIAIRLTATMVCLITGGIGDHELLSQPYGS